MISKVSNEEFSETRNCHLRSTCSNCKCKSQVGGVQLVTVGWGEGGQESSQLRL